MVTVNGYAISPLKIGDDGDTRASSDGGSLQAPPNNPNYSSLTAAIKIVLSIFSEHNRTSKTNIHGDLVW